MTAASSESAWTGIVELPENRLALKAVQRLAKNLGRKVHSPMLMLHGPAGTGKSLLANALVRRVIRGAKVRTVQSIPANELTFALDADVDIDDLLAVDLLIVEDLQHLSVNAVPTLSRLIDERNQRRQAMLMTANVGPAKLKKLPRRLVSRLAGGLVIAIESLSVASRKAVLSHYVQMINLSLEPEALDWLASRSSGGSVRPLLGMLDSLKSQHRGRATPMTLDQVKRIASVNSQPLGVERIIQRVAETYGVKAKELLGPSRLRNVLLPRHVAMFLARDLALLSLPRIGEHFGGRDHSTVQHAVNKIRTAIADDQQLAGTIRQLRLELV